jgi:leader peptidase (prepilin peptidase)/N-methyltransferase
VSGIEVFVIALSAAPFAYLAVITVVLVVIDIRTHRLPDRIVLPSYPVALALFAASSFTASSPGGIVRALAGMVILFVGYAVIRLVSPPSIGGGDVKLAGLIGLYLGWCGWGAIMVGMAAAFVIGGAQALILMALRRADGRTRIAFGPAMLLGAWTSIALSPVVSRAI